MPLSSRRIFPPVNKRRRAEHLEVAETVNKGHGRVEQRRLETSTRLSGLGWPGLEQVCRIKRRVRREGRWTEEIAYAISSVPRSQASAAQLLKWWRGHWGIENRSHHVRDATLGEDACRIRKGKSPHSFAALRNATVSFLRLQGHTNVAAAFRACTWQSQQLFSKLGIFKK